MLPRNHPDRIRIVFDERATNGISPVNLLRIRHPSAPAVERRRDAVLLYTVTGPVPSPASARSRVAVSMGSAPAAARKFRRPRAVSQTTSRGRGRTAAAIRR